MLTALMPRSAEANYMHLTKIDLPSPDTFALRNGFKTVFVQDNSNPVLCLQLYIKTGSLHESPLTTGYSHFLEHLVFKSSQAYPNNKISRIVNELGGLLNAYTDFDSTCFYLLLPSEALATGLQVLSELAMHSNFTKKDVALEKHIILEEIKQYKNDPEPDHIEWIQKTCFADSPLRQPVLGTTASIKAATWERLKEFQKIAYRPQNSFLVVCGDFHPDDLKSRVQLLFGDWEASTLERRTDQSSEPALAKAGIGMRSKVNSELLLSFVLPELCEQHPQANALLIAMRYFAIGKASRLFKALVDEQRLCSSVKVSSLSGSLSGASVITCSPLAHKYIPHIISCFHEELVSLLSQPIPASELELIKQDIIHSWLFSFEGMENLANLVAMEEFIGNLERLHTYGQQIQSISAQEVFAAASHYWKPDNLRVYCESDKAYPALKKQAKPLFRDFETDPESFLVSDPNKANQLEISFPGNTKPVNKTSCLTQISDDLWQIVLSNGMQVLYRHQKLKPVCGFSLSTHISQLCETESERGTNYFCSSLLLYSTQRYSHADLMRIGRSNGFNIRVTHHLDSTSFRGKCLADKLPLALSLLAELISQPSFDSDHFKLLKSNALDSIRRERSNPLSVAYHHWFKMLVGKNSNLFRSTGDPTEIRKLPRSALQNWHARWNLGKDFRLGLVGNHAVEYISGLCETIFGEFNSGTSNLEARPFMEVQPSRKLSQPGRTDQALIHLGGFACPAVNREENAAFYVLAHILGGDISSRFYDILREKYGFAYQTGFDFSSISSLGFWNAYAFCDKQDYRHCLSLMQEIIAEIVTKGVDESELNAAKHYLIGMNRFDLESASYCASSLSTLAALGYEPDYYLNREQRINAVSAEQIQHIAASYLSSDKQYLHILV